MDVIMGFTEQFVRTIKPLSHAIHRQGEHRDIFEAIRQRDSDKTVRITIRHITYINSEMKKLEEKYLDFDIHRLNRGITQKSK